MTTPVLIGWIALGLSLAALLLSQIMYSWDMYWVRRHSSRFPMFAVRDQLIELVCDGEMDESETAWCTTYLTVNSLLDLEKNHTIWGSIGSYLSHSRRMKRDPKRRAQLKEIMNAIEDRAKETPRFGDALIALGRAHSAMVRGQVHWWDRIAILLLSIVLKVLVTILSPFAGRSKTEAKSPAKEEEAPQEPGPESSMTMTARRPLDWYRGVRPRSANELVGWRADNRDRVAAY